MSVAPLRKHTNPPGTSTSPRGNTSNPCKTLRACRRPDPWALLAPAQPTLVFCLLAKHANKAQGHTPPRRHEIAQMECSGVLRQKIQKQKYMKITVISPDQDPQQSVPPTSFSQASRRSQVWVPGGGGRAWSLSPTRGSDFLTGGTGGGIMLFCSCCSVGPFPSLTCSFLAWRLEMIEMGKYGGCWDRVGMRQSDSG